VGSEADTIGANSKQLNNIMIEKTVVARIDILLAKKGVQGL
jgi:hypothetical protein